MGYKLIAFDLDGTLHDRASGTPVTDRTKEAVKKVREMGAEVTIATGRMFNSTLPFCSQLGLTVPIICYQGALIGDPVTQEVLWEKPIPLPLAHQVIRLIEETGVSPFVFVRDHFYVRARTPRVESYEDTLQIEADPVGDLTEHVREAPTKVVVTGEDHQIDLVVDRVRSRLGSCLSIIKTYSHLCEIGHPEGSKALALKRLAGQLNVRREETVAVGDSLNDVDMIRWAGLGVAMGNAPPEVQSAADLVVRPASGDGVAQLLEDLMARGQISPLV